MCMISTCDLDTIHPLEIIHATSSEVAQIKIIIDLPSSKKCLFTIVVYITVETLFNVQMLKIESGNTPRMAKNQS